MDESTTVSQEAYARAIQSSEPDSNKQRTTCSKTGNCSGTDDGNLLKVPQRKLSVFYRSFDVIASKDQGEAYEFRRTSSSPSVRLEKTQDKEWKSNDAYEETSSCKKGFVNNCRSLIESGKFLSGSSLDRITERTKSNPQFSTTKSVPLSAFKLPRVRENTFVDHNAATTDASSIEKHFESNSNGNDGRKDANENVGAVSRENSSPGSDDFFFVVDAESPTDERLENGRRDSPIDSTSDFMSKHDPRSTASGTQCNGPILPSADLAKIKDSTSPRAFSNASSAVRLGKYTSVRPEMSNHQDSSIGSDNEDDSFGENVDVTYASVAARKNEIAETGNVPSQPSSSFSIGEVPRKPDSTEIDNKKKTKYLAGFRSTRAKRQNFSTARRSLSESDSEQYHSAKRHCGCGKQASSNDWEQVRAFPSFTDARLRSMKLLNSEEMNSLYRENFALSENELERRYIAFSIGLSIDRITLHRRLTLSRRQRDLSERNFTNEIQGMQEDIQELSPLCTDRESMEKVEKVRCRLDTIKKCAYRTCYASETLGAVQQEQRICGGVSIADKYLRILRSKCENLAAEIAEIKRILLIHNIVIEEGTGEIGDDVSKLRYSNNRTMVSRRRASIATISGPTFSQDTIKEGPRQRNSVSGRVTLLTQRRPSLCSEVQRWENDKLNRTDSSNSVTELRDISEQTESRRNSLEENNNLPRCDRINNTETVNCDVNSNVETENQPSSSSSSSSLEFNITKNVEKQFKSCIQKAEPLRITSHFHTWRPILWCSLVFFLGFYANYITSSANTCEHIATVTS
ncbi:uncharacterized protein LOC143341154 isoform X1 [Colletes latitarsis]|uniref:uncharacterized protein LOC143341154 isoform X1 n=1 Tax=Colletes latitarsis TaxID=2605962 RepID=UPI0040366769